MDASVATVCAELAELLPTRSAFDAARARRLTTVPSSSDVLVGVRQPDASAPDHPAAGFNLALPRIGVAGEGVWQGASMADVGVVMRAQGYASDLCRPGQVCAGLNLRRAKAVWTVKRASPVDVLRRVRAAADAEPQLELARCVPVPPERYRRAMRMGVGSRIAGISCADVW